MAASTLLQTIFKPRLLVPAVRVPSIRHVDFQALKRAGYKGAIFDKDNCLTLPHRDRLVPQLQVAWQECIDTFGRSNVVIVSNASGTRSDPGGLEAESVAHHLGVAVLMHSVKKPGCSSTIVNYFRNRPPDVIAALPAQLDESAPTASMASMSQIIGNPPIPPSGLVVVGDRILTDVVLGNKLGALSIWTTGLWERELMPMRYFEYCLVGVMDLWDRCVSSPKWERNRALPSETEKSKLPTPQELYTRIPPAAPPTTPNTVARVARVLGRWSIVVYRGTNVAASSIMTRWRQRQKQAAANSSGDILDVVKPPVNDPLRVRVISASRRGFLFVGSRLAGAFTSGVMSLVGNCRVQDAFTGLRRLLSRCRARSQRVQAFWRSRLIN